MDAFFMVKKNLNSLNKLLVDGMEQSILGLDLVLQQQLHHLQVLVVDGHEERRPAKRINTIDVNCPILPAITKHPKNNFFENQSLKNIFDNC